MRSNSITSKSIFGGYKKGEDIVTAALLHLMELGGPALMNSLFGDIGVETTTHVNTQVKGKSLFLMENCVLIIIFILKVKSSRGRSITIITSVSW